MKSVSVEKHEGDMVMVPRQRYESLIELYVVHMADRSAAEVERKGQGGSGQTGKEGEGEGERRLDPR